MNTEKQKIWTVALDSIHAPIVAEWTFLKEAKSCYIVQYEGRRYPLPKNKKKGFFKKEEAVAFRNELINRKIAVLVETMDKLEKELDSKTCCVRMREEGYEVIKDLKL